MIDTPEKQIEAPQPESEDTSTRKVWWIVGGSITGAVLLTAMTFFGAWIWSVSSPEETASYNEEFTQAVTGVDVAVEVGDIELNASGGDALVVDREARWRGSEPEIVEQRHGDTFTAVGNCDDGMFSFGGDKCEVDYTIALPSGAAAEANNDIGEIHLDGLDGAIDVETSVGDIDGENLRATETKVESSVGSIELEFDQVLGDINVTTSTGDVEIVVPDDGTTFEVRFESSVGSQNLDIDTSASSHADYVITVATSVGDLSVRYAD